MTNLSYSLVDKETAPRPRRYSIPAYRVALVRDGGLARDERPKIQHSSHAEPIFREWIGPTDREHFVILCLDAKNQVVGLNTVSVGSLTASIVHPREVMKPAILLNAQSVLICHNHPSGDPQPSKEDLSITARLKECFTLFGIALLDHLILGEDSFWSMRDHNQL